MSLAGGLVADGTGFVDTVGKIALKANQMGKYTIALWKQNTDIYSCKSDKIANSIIKITF